MYMRQSTCGVGHGFKVSLSQRHNDASTALIFGTAKHLHARQQDIRHLYASSAEACLLRLLVQAVASGTLTLQASQVSKQQHTADQSTFMQTLFVPAQVQQPPRCEVLLITVLQFQRPCAGSHAQPCTAPLAVPGSTWSAWQHLQCCSPCSSHQNCLLICARMCAMLLQCARCRKTCSGGSSWQMWLGRLTRTHCHHWTERCGSSTLCYKPAALDAL